MIPGRTDIENPHHWKIAISMRRTLKWLGFYNVRQAMARSPGGNRDRRARRTAAVVTALVQVKRGLISLQRIGGCIWCSTPM